VLCLHFNLDGTKNNPAFHRVAFHTLLSKLYLLDSIHLVILLKYCWLSQEWWATRWLNDTSFSHNQLLYFWSGKLVTSYAILVTIKTTLIRTKSKRNDQIWELRYENNYVVWSYRRSFSGFTWGFRKLTISWREIDKILLLLIALLLDSGYYFPSNCTPKDQ